MKAARLQVMGAVAAFVGVWALVAGGCASEQQKRGKELYAHYCMHCHGENGRQNEGFNWSSMPDPKPKDLSNKSEMSTFKDEEIFNTISRDMKDTSPGGDKIGDDEFAVPTMPTFKYTLSEDEIWAIVSYVRSLHGMKLEFKVEERKKELAEAVKSAQAKFDEAKQAYEAAEKKANEEAEKKSAALKKDVDVDESAYAKEQAAMGQAKKALDEAQAAVNYFVIRPGKGVSVVRPDLTMKPEQAAALAETGKKLYSNKYGCNGCHSLAGEGGKVGPTLDRAGFRLNGTWIYRWVKNPQAMKPETRMPALGLSDADAKAVTMYLATLRAPKPEEAPATASKPAS
jgi:mono/diheme cytochrome c family protein